VTRTGGALLGLLLLGGCSLESPASSPSTSPSAVTPSGCIRLAAPAVPPDGPPTAILRDVAGGPREFLIGSPGGTVSRIAEATGSSAPRLGGDRVFFSVGQGTTNQEIRAARPGECSTHFATGTMTEVDPQGRALVVGDAGHARMLDASGRPIVEVAGPSGTWTADGHLAVPTAASGLKVYDLSGAAKDVNLPAGSTPSGPLGVSQEMISTPAGVQAIDLRDGKLQPLPLPLTTQRLLSGSPDGNYVALIDSQGIPEIVSLRDGHSMRLPTPGPSLGALWERRSQWVAVQSLYGGSAMRVADGKVVETGSLNVVSW
jgi:hypothetical protein